MGSEEWPEVRLRDLVDERGISYGIVQPGVACDDGVPFVRVNNLQEGRIVTDEVKRVAPEIEAKYGRTRLRGGEVLVSLVGSLGQTAIVPPRLRGWNVARAVAVVPVRRDIGADWVAYALQSPGLQHRMRARATTTVQATLNLQDVRELPIPLPAKSERDKAASVLRALDDKIALNRLMNLTLESIARAVFESWFVDFDPVRGKMEGGEVGLPPDLASCIPDGFEEFRGRSVPRGWPVAPLGLHVATQRGLSYTGAGLSAEGVPMHNLNSILEGGGHKPDGMKYYNGEFDERREVVRGDVLVANTEQGHERRLIGFACLVPSLHGEIGIFSHHLFRLRPLPQSPLSAAYVCYLLNSGGVHAEVSGYATGTTVNTLPKDALERPLVVVPPIPLIKAFTDLAVHAAALEEALVLQSRSLAATRDELLPRLLSGPLGPNARAFVEEAVS